MLQLVVDGDNLYLIMKLTYELRSELKFKANYWSEKVANFGNSSLKLHVLQGHRMRSYVYSFLQQIVEQARRF